MTEVTAGMIDVYKVIAEVIASGIAALAIAGVGLGMGRAVAAVVESIARNPAAADKVRTLGIIGMAFTEMLGLLIFAIVFLILQK